MKLFLFLTYKGYYDGLNWYSNGNWQIHYIFFNVSIFPFSKQSCPINITESRYDTFFFTWSTLVKVMGCCWRYQAITWTNVVWSSVKSSDIHIKSITQEMHQPSITKICLKITCLQFNSNFPGANKLRPESHFAAANEKCHKRTTPFASRCPWYVGIISIKLIFSPTPLL